MARRRTELEKQPEAGEDRFAPFAEVFTASAAADAAADTGGDAGGGPDGAPAGRARRRVDPRRIPRPTPKGSCPSRRTRGTSRRNSPLRPGRGCPG